jgi:two-component system, NtrC family, sensor histidine kinase KinB
VTDNIDLSQQNKILTQEIKRHTNQMAAINMVAAAVGNSLDLDDILQTALETTVYTLEADASGISLIDEKAEELVLRAQLGWQHDFVSNPMRIPLGMGFSGRVIENDDAMIWGDLDGTEEFAVPSFGDEHFRSIVMAPMHSRTKVIGILSIMGYEPNIFDQASMTMLRVIADTVGVALDNARLYEQSVEHEQRLSAIINSTADGIIATDNTSRISLVNHAAESMLDIRQGELLGVPLREVRLQTEVRELLLDALSAADNGDGPNKSFQVNLEDELVISVMVSPVVYESQVDKAAQTDGWVIVLQDVTYRREEQLARAKFIQAAAHDMRNPLSVTQSALGILATMVEEDVKTKEVIGIAQGGVDRLGGLIQDLLHLEHIESGYNLVLQEISILDTLHEVSMETSVLMYEKHINFKEEIDSDLPTMLKADIRWLKRALHNYLDNASKYTQEHGAVTLRVYAKDQHLHIEVSDNGPGIAVSAQSRLFERFYRVKVHKNVDGTGLGLAIVKSVAEAHGGTVYVHSAPEKGSTFGLKLPL